VADATLFVAKSGATRMRSVLEATSGLRRDRIRQLGVVLVGTSSPILRSASMRTDFRDHPDTEFEELEPPAPPRPVQFSPRPAAPDPEPAAAKDDQRNPEVTDLNKAAERNRRAAE
jgi:hypothetical protein